MYCKDYIIMLLKQKGGQSTRAELRPFLLEHGYGSDAIWQAFLKLKCEGKIILKGSNKSKYQIVELNKYNEANVKN